MDVKTINGTKFIVPGDGFDFITQKKVTDEDNRLYLSGMVLLSASDTTLWRDATKEERDEFYAKQKETGRLMNMPEI